jgi:hypothetical protein
MAFQISPGVNVSEVDLTTVVPSVLTTTGAFAGGFQWGPANKIKTIDSEITLVNTFGKPDSNTYTSFFSAASFLAYGNNLKTVRAVGDTSFNAISDAGGPNLLIENEDIFEDSYVSFIEFINCNILSTESYNQDENINKYTKLYTLYQ